MLVNTSFNVRGEPIVCTPDDALRCFQATDMDALVLEDFLLDRRDLPRGKGDVREEHLARFALD
jgi:carbamoyltransferase